MKLTTEQEELLVVLVAVEDYKTDKKYKSNELLDKIGDLGMEENGFYMDEQIDDFKALKSNNLIKFECEDWDKDEEIDDYIISPITYIEVLDKGRNYIKHMNDSIIRKMWESIKKYWGNLNLSPEAFVKIEVNLMKM